MFRRAQDQASMQLSEMEEEMDQRIQAAERKTQEQVGLLRRIQTVHQGREDLRHTADRSISVTPEETRFPLLCSRYYFIVKLLSSECESLQQSVGVFS